MFPLPEEFSTATKHHFEAQLAMITALTSKAFDSVEKIIDLNMNAVKASLEESTEATKQLMEIKDPQAFVAMSSSQAQPGAEKAIAYSRHLAAIAASAQAEFTKAAETQIAETKQKVMALVEQVSKNAPAGSEQMIAIMKAAVNNANASYEQLTKTTKQAVQAMEGNINNAVSQMTAVAEKGTGRGKK